MIEQASHTMDESALQQSLELYKGQLAQIEQAIAAAGETEELERLRCDLQELISLTEGSLLSFKKSQLLKSLEDAENSIPALAEKSGGGTSSLDDEYAAFQALLAEDGQDGSSSSAPSSTATGDNPASEPTLTSNTFPFIVKGDETPFTVRNKDSDSDSDDSSSNTSDDSNSSSSSLGKGGKMPVDEELSNLVGMKCRAPFAHDWGKMDYHNALVMSAEREEGADQILVKVMYTTPTHVSMLPCKFYLDGRCRFPDDQCRYSHGNTVQLEKLREFLEADHSNVTVEMKCLAQYTDNVWYPATVTDVKVDSVSVHFDDYGEDMEVEISQIVPAVVHEESDNEDDAEDQDPVASTSGQGKTHALDSDEEEEELPVFLWKPPQTTAAIGEWEAHTRGIASKLMAKMGYVVGQGLGADGQGKAEPVPILLLPQGKSLDRIMELKAMAGDSDLFNAMKKLEKQKLKADKKREQQALAADLGQGQGQGHSNVFDFINNRLGGKKGNLASLSAAGGRQSAHAGGDNQGPESGKRNISEHELHKRSDRDINLQVFKTHQEIRNVERQIDKLRESLARNENKDRAMAAQVRSRLTEQETYLASLKTSSTALDKHQQKRSANKKLTIF